MHKKLPIQEITNELISIMQQRDEAVLQAPPGAGKTTIVPLEFLHNGFLNRGKLLMLEPRRIAAKNAASRMAHLLSEQVGETVGYRMRLETRVSQNTKIEVVTEGVLIRLLQDDPALSEYSIVIFDEFHERSLNADLGLALVLKSREVFREAALKVLIMSATLNLAGISELLNQAPVVTSEGRSFPVEIQYDGTYIPRERIVDRTLRVLLKILNKHPATSVLVFLPGEGEIRQVQRLLNQHTTNNLTISPLFGNLDLSAQRDAIEPVQAPQRKVVLATNIAESSLTIEGVTAVLDTGLERRARFDPNTGTTRLQTNRISQASATQRAGRAGRLAPGICYRLWSEEQQAQMQDESQPEILEAELSQLALQILNWGVSGPQELSWLTPPPQAHWHQAISQLNEFEAVLQQDNQIQLTEHGREMAQLSEPPRISHMLLWAKLFGAAEMGAALAALWSERDPFSRSPQMGTNIDSRLDILLEQEPCPPEQRGWLNRSQRLMKQCLNQLRQVNTNVAESIPTSSIVGCLVALAYPDRIARRRHGGGYQLANGRSAQLAEPNKTNAKWLAVAEVTGSTGSSDTIRTAQILDIELLNGPLAFMVRDQKLIEWDKRSNRFVAERQSRIGELVLERQSISEVPEEDRVATICQFVASKGLKLFKRYSEFKILQARCGIAMQARPIAAYELSEEVLLKTLEQWLGPYLAKINRIETLEKIDINKICLDRMSFAETSTLDKLAPIHHEVPSGSKYKIDYTESPPVLAVKLQEMFGASETPTIANGQVKLLVHLLSPAGRPLQVTQDLKGFWHSSYHQVRKDMRGRYPKHPWPEDPSNALPTRNTKNRT